MVVTALKTAKTLWKPSFGSFAQEPLGAIFLRIYVLGKQLTTVLIVGP